MDGVSRLRNSTRPKRKVSTPSRILCDVAIKPKSPKFGNRSQLRSLGYMRDGLRINCRRNKHAIRSMSDLIDFSLPPNLSAREPPERRRSRRRDAVRLLVISRRTGDVTHSRFERLCDFLVPGDLLVFNASRTLPALLSGWRDSDRAKVELRLASHLSDNSWLALIRSGPENCLFCKRETL